ncbi:hypothetical protein WJX81_007918 [Elliptochloris bilobata]|uniref:Uncharacterized protein n=1 Tax=Elliptochloris bilobata TaxID=381761 RepID=A0AAW1QLB9_9CHLO
MRFAEASGARATLPPASAGDVLANLSRPATGRRGKRPCLATQPSAVAAAAVGAVACTGTVVDLGLVEAVLAAAVSGHACPPRTSNRTNTRRALAPAYCLAVSKTRRKRGRPAGDGAGGGGDDGGSGGGDGSGWNGWDDGAGWGGGRADGVWLWQALCMCSLLQAAHYVLRSGEERGPSSGTFASLASSLYGPSTRQQPQAFTA